jgi:mRNA interferase RelE/StbE
VTYRIEVTPAARRDLTKLPSETLRRVDAHILALAENPFPAGAKKLQSSEPIFRIRVGDYRILYTVEHHRLVILVIRIGHRCEIYRAR